MLIEQLRQDMTAAMKAKETQKLSVLRSAIAAVQKESVSEANARELNDAEVEKVIASEAKKRQEAADAFVEAKRQDRADAELAEKAILEKYLPEQLSDEELTSLVDKVIADNQFSDMKDMGAAMKAINAEVAGRADGGKVAGLVKAKLG